jgi:hypothetical protein
VPVENQIAAALARFRMHSPISTTRGRSELMIMAAGPQPLSPSASRAAYISPEAVRQNFEAAAQWSRFYHDCEIKVNAAATLATSLLTFGVSNKEAFKIPFSHPFGTHLNMMGLVIIIISCTALFSTFVYWSYYEYTWILATRWRRLLIDSSVTDDVSDRAEKKFAKTFKWFPKIRYNGHHYIWMALQVVMAAIGVVMLAGHL